jgi:hypothetical protein
MTPFYPLPDGIGARLALLSHYEANTPQFSSEKEMSIFSKLSQKVSASAQEYIELYSDYLELTNKNNIVRKNLKYNPPPALPKESVVEPPLSEEENTYITREKNNVAINNFASQLFLFMQQVAQLKSINRAICEENLKLQRDTLREIPTLSVSTLDEKKEATPPPKMLKLHPSEKQKQLEALPKKPATNPNGEKWLEDLKNVLARNKKEILTSYPKGPSPAALGEEVLYADFLNRYVENPHTFISLFPLSESDVEIINIAIEYLDGRKRRIAADSFK